MSALVDGVLDRDLAAVRSSFSDCQASGADAAVLLDQIVEALHARLEVHVAAAAADTGAAPALDRLLGVLQILSETGSKLRGSAYPSIAVEVALLKAARLEEPQALEEVIRHLSSIEAGGGGGEGGTPARPTGAPGGGGAHDRTGGAASSRPTHRSSQTGPSRSGVTKGPATPEASLTARAVEGGTSVASAPPTMTESVTGFRATPDAHAATSVATTPQVRARGAESLAETSNASEARHSDPPGASRRRPSEPAPPGTTSADPASTELSAGAGDFDRLISLWDQVVVELQEKHSSLAPFVEGTRPTLQPSGSVQLGFDRDFYLRRMKAKANRESLENLVRDITGEVWSFEMVRSDSPSSVAGPARRPPGEPASVPELPASANSSPPPLDRVSSEGDRAKRAGVEAAEEDGRSSVNDEAPVTVFPGGAKAALAAAKPGAHSSAVPTRLDDHEIVAKAKKLFNGRVV